ncbi:MAG: hypothetical protein JKX94_03050, partial [Sneathiella sp.]|nr:hypothetical protein [Sneathiella sp.]
VAWGRKGYLAWELHGSKGMLRFDQERMNELYLYQAEGNNRTDGFKTILTGPSHPPYGLFTPAPGHGLGFNDLKVIEIAHLLKGVMGQEKLYPDFSDALHIEKVIHGIVESSNSRSWLELNVP